MPHDRWVAFQARRRRGNHISTHGEQTQRLNDLLARISVGDRSAFDGFYALVSGPVFGTVNKIVRNRAIAEEVAHDVLTEVWRRAQDWDPVRGNAGAWIFTIARRRAIDRVRSEQASHDRTLRIGASTGDREHDQVSETVIEREERAEVSVFLATLNDLQRQAIGLAFFEGHTQQEISELLGVPLGTVKTRIRDGLIALRQQLGGAG